MAAQNYRNHRKFYPPHHFVFLPLCLGLMVYGIIKIFKTDAEEKLIWGLFSITVLLILFLAVMLRQHYAWVTRTGLSVWSSSRDTLNFLVKGQILLKNN